MSAGYLARARDARARDRVHLHAGQEPADAEREEQPPDPWRESGWEAGKEPGEKHVVARREAHALGSVAPEPSPVVERRADERHVRLPAVRADDQRARR